jgi:hypothetical protein
MMKTSFGLVGRGLALLRPRRPQSWRHVIFNGGIKGLRPINDNENTIVTPSSIEPRR